MTEAELVTKLVAEHEELEKKLVHYEQAIKGIKERMDAISHGEIPSALARAGIAKLTTTTGVEVSVKHEVYCSISKTDLQSRQRAFNWLKEVGAGELIKDQVIVDEMNEEDLKVLAQRYHVEHKQDVHPQSLKAFMRRGLGISGSQVAFSEEEVPADIHLYTTPITVMSKGA